MISSGKLEFFFQVERFNLGFSLHNRWEFKRCPKVVVAKVDPKKFAEQTPYMPAIPSVSACSPHLLPARVWEAEFLADFSNLRMVSILLFLLCILRAMLFSSFESGI